MAKPMWACCAVAALGEGAQRHTVRRVYEGPGGERGCMEDAGAECPEVSCQNKSVFSAVATRESPLSQPKDPPLPPPRSP